MQLRTLGGLALEGSGFTRPKPLVLLAYLTLEGPQMRRDLAALFYHGAANPMRSLASELNRLRTGAPGSVAAEGGRVWSEVEADAQALLTALDRNEPSEGLELHAGRFLDGVSLAGWSAGLEEWVYGTRELLAERVRSALLRQAEEGASEGDFGSGAELAGRAYLLSGAPEPRPEDLARLHRLLLAGESREEDEVRKEARGYGLELAADPEGARSELRAMAAERRTPHNLPVPATPFVGRSGDLERLRAQLADRHGRLLTVVGPGGIGKTRLAVEVARASRATFEDGVFFVPFVAVPTADLMVFAIADALGLRFFQHDDPQRQLLAFLSDKEMLLVLDNLEHLLGGVALLGEILRAAPGVRLLATSRERLDLLSERVFDLDGLDFPVGEGSEVADFDAVALLVRSGRNHRSDFEIDAGNRESLARICRLVEGHPLALELAASWLRVLTPADIVAEIERGLDILHASARDLPERHRSLRAAFDHSWRLLDPAERSALRRLAVFRGGFRREAAREVVGASLLVLAGLVDKSLLNLEADGRYALHPLLHEFCREKLAAEPDERGSVEERHGLYYLHFLRSQEVAMQDVAGSRWRDVFALQREELGNVRAAWRWTVAASRVAELTGSSLLWAFTFINNLKEGSAFFAQAIAELDPNDPNHRAALGNLLIGRAQVQLWFSEIGPAHRSVREGLDLVRRRGDPQSIMHGLLVQGWAWWFSGDYREAKATHEEGLSLARAENSSADIIYFLVGLGSVYQEIEESAESRAYHQGALAEVRALGNAFNLGNYLLHLGMYLVNGGRWDEARACLDEGLAHALEMGDALQQRYFLHYQGRLAWREGSFEEASALFRRMLAMAERHGDRFLQVYALSMVSRALLVGGDLPEAWELALRGLELALSVGSSRAVSAALVSSAGARAAQGGADEAAQWLRLALSHPSTEQFYRQEAEAMLDAASGVRVIEASTPRPDPAGSPRWERVLAEALRALASGRPESRR